MQLCVGAASRRIVKEAAKLGVHQIVASRRQVKFPSGYIGLSPDGLVKTVRELSDGKTRVVRDHGGPLQGGFDDDGREAFDFDVDAGFNGLHIDVCELPRDQQIERLVNLCHRYNGLADLEVGGEHESPSWNTQLLAAVHDAGIQPSYVVVGVGTHVWADQQIGHVRDGRAVRGAVAYANKLRVKTKAHNMDWVYGRRKLPIDAYNLAPELGQIEVRAILTVLPPAVATGLLEWAYHTGRWQRWFGEDEGTYVQRAECALRYLLEDHHVKEVIRRDWTDDCERFVQRCVRDAIVHG